MPTIKYPNNPNVETAFVEQDDGTKNRVVMTAPQDISTIEYPNNPNSTKAYVTVNGKKQRVVMTADITGGGGGGAVTSVNGKTGDVVLTAKDVDALPQFDSMPAASSTNSGDIVQYTGTTSGSYTNGYFYKNVATTTPSSATATQSVGASLSDIAVDVETLESFTGWTTDNSLQIFYTGDGWSVDTTSLGVTYTGTPSVGDAITISYTAAVTTYAWTRIDVQPAPEALPSQTGNAGKFLTTDGTDASWSDKPFINKATNDNSFSTHTNTTTRFSFALGPVSSVANFSFACGMNASAGTDSIVLGTNARAGTDSLALGKYSRAANSAIILSMGLSTFADNNDANTFKVANANGNYELMSADGTVPSDRLTHAINKYSTMPTAASTNEGWIVQFIGTTDANYTHGYIYECKAQGTTPETYAWEAVEVQASGGGGLPSQSGNAGKFLTTDGTDASWSDEVLVNLSASDDGLSVGSTASAVWRATAVGISAAANASRSISIGIGSQATSSSTCGIAIGQYTSVTDVNAIQLGSVGTSGATNSDANTFKVANENGNFEMMDANGNLPADRLASTTGLADGNYRLRLTMASGVPTLSWVAE